MEENTTKKYELVFIAGPGASHIVPTVEFAKTLLDTDHRFSITVLTMNSPLFPVPSSYIDSVPEIRFIELTRPDSPPPEMKHSLVGLCEFVDHYKPHSRQVITQLIATELDPNSVSLAALVLDMFTTPMIDIADELGVPSYVYFTSGVALLDVFIQFPAIDSAMETDLKNELTRELEFPSFKNSVPAIALPSVLWTKNTDDYACHLHIGRRIGETKGVIINTFYDLETYAIDSFGSTVPGYPQIYSIGPVLDLAGRVNSGKSKTQHNENIMKWLDEQPNRSVVFLCFGSKGTFEVDQVREIANGLERSRHRFLWSVQGKDKSTPVEELVPEGFVERTVERGMVCGWVPQVAVLGHGSVGCFVSHCGWNSILESFWFGVPILTWPMYAEQHLNAFLLVKELGLSVELKGYDRVSEDDLVKADEVERGVRRFMGGECEEVRKKVDEMKEKSRRALKKGGSSVASIKRLIEDLVQGR
ncbi:hypothetical protein Scep_013304 [Stephania cephalantha]|uniref:Glycosyltransferase n=1 Tax=Stephania cephalantha TaxID=152367 RepID=A0AAP0JGV8_9MAGN